jgi:hypothetical protein
MLTCHNSFRILDLMFIYFGLGGNIDGSRGHSVVDELNRVPFFLRLV